MTATFGDFLRPATGHIAAAVAYPGDVPDEARPGVIRQLDRVVTALAHFLADAAPGHAARHESAGRRGSQARAVIDARVALRRAAQSLRHAATVLDETGNDDNHPVVAHLTAAADNLGAGRDVLQSHFARGPFGGWEGTSYWSPAIRSRPVTAALMSELADCARTLAPWAARLSLAGPMDAEAPAPACLSLHTATRWLWVAGTTIEASLRQHPPAEEAPKLLAAVPANFPSPRMPPTDGESVHELCEGITISAERLRHAALAFTAQARWSPQATSGTWRKNALAAAITGHASELALRTLSIRARQLGLDPAIRQHLRTASRELGKAWEAWRSVAHEWDIISTGLHRDPHPAQPTLEFGDLALRLARLAHSNHNPTAGIVGSGAARAPSALAPTAGQVQMVIAAIHQAADAVTRAGAEDQDAVRTARADDRLYLPTRFMPARNDIPHPYTHAPQAATETLIQKYDAAITETTRAAATLDELALTLATQSWPLGTLRAPAPQVSHSPQVIAPGISVTTGQRTRLPLRPQQAIR